METQKIINLLNDSINKESKFATEKWYVIDIQTGIGKYNKNNSIKCETESIKSNLCDYSDALVLVTWNIAVTANNNTDVAFKNFPHVKQINDVFIDEANYIYIPVPRYDLIESVIILPIHQEVYGSLKKTMLIWVLIILNHLNIKHLF